MDLTTAFAVIAYAKVNHSKYLSALSLMYFNEDPISQFLKFHS